MFTSIGPGAVNTAVGVASAYMNSSSMLVFTGAVHTYMFGRGVLQEIGREQTPARRHLRPVTKRHWQVSHTDQLPQALDTA